MPSFTCPDCDEPVFFTFMDTSGLGGWKRGDAYNPVADTSHFICFPCGKTWKQRQDGPLTPDIIGDIAFFTCRSKDCGEPLLVTRESAIATEIELTCPNGHGFSVETTDEGGLTLAKRRSP